MIPVKWEKTFAGDERKLKADHNNWYICPFALATRLTSLPAQLVSTPAASHSLRTHFVGDCEWANVTFYATQRIPIEITRSAIGNVLPNRICGLVTRTGAPNTQQILHGFLFSHSDDLRDTISYNEQSKFGK